MNVEFKSALNAALVVFIVGLLALLGYSLVPNHSEHVVWTLDHGLTVGFGFFFGGLVGKSSALPH